MLRTSLRTVAVIGAGISLVGVSARGLPLTYNWYHPCPCPGRSTDPDFVCTMDDTCDCLVCSCFGSWNTSDNWRDVYGVPGIPDQANEVAKVILSNTGCCGATTCACSQQSNCAGGCSGTCGNAESTVSITLGSTFEISELHLITDDTNATTEALSVELRSTYPYVYTLTAGSVVLDARKGAITLTVPGAWMQTNLAD